MTYYEQKMPKYYQKSSAIDAAQWLGEPDDILKLLKGEKTGLNIHQKSIYYIPIIHTKVAR
jgi:pseudouridine-5'-phosphate glycosidase